MFRRLALLVALPVVTALFSVGLVAPAQAAEARLQIETPVRVVNLTKGATSRLVAAAFKGHELAATPLGYSSSNKKVVTVTAGGKLTAKKAGKATITIRAGEATRKVTVTVTAARSRTKTQVALSPSMTVGEYHFAVVNFGKATNQKVSFASSNHEVVTIDRYGRVHAKSAGTAVISLIVAGRPKATALHTTVTVAERPVCGEGGC